MYKRTGDVFTITHSLTYVFLGAIFLSMITMLVYTVGFDSGLFSNTVYTIGIVTLTVMSLLLLGTKSENQFTLNEYFIQRYIVFGVRITARRCSMDTVNSHFIMMSSFSTNSMHCSGNDSASGYHLKVWVPHNKRGFEPIIAGIFFDKNKAEKCKKDLISFINSRVSL